MSARSSALSLFDKQFEDLLRGLRVVGKDLGNSEDGTKETQLTVKERAPGKGNMFNSIVVQLFLSKSVNTFSIRV